VQKITPFLWFDDQAEEAAKFYISLFPKSKILKLSRYSDAAAKTTGRPKGSVMVVWFQLEGQQFAALNGGPHFKFNEAVSLMVNCKTQAEIDKYWKKLSAGGKESQCGWLKDKYGLSWQIVPESLPDLLGSGDSATTERVMEAVMQMGKLDIKKLKRAFAAKPKKSK
jgi:predicted 3-demethylubiquinone-9 3-methyltransferase (glyoxalase superfamily)